MSKNKFFKKLLIGGLCALTATAMIGATACDKGGDDNGDDPNPPIVTTDEYTVSFNLDGGSWGKAEGYTVKVEKDGKLSATDIETPTKEGYEFAGWFNGSTPFVVGTTAVTSNITLTAHWSEVIPEEKTNSWYPEPVGTGDASSTTFEADSTIADTDYFEIKTSLAAIYDIGAQSNVPTHQFSFTLDGHTVDQAVRLNESVENGAEIKSVYTVTAKETCVVTLYLNFINASHNSARIGAQVLYSLEGNDGNVTLYKDSVDKASYITLSLEVGKDETLTLGVNNESGNTGALWLYGAKAEEVAENSVSVNYYDGETLLAKESVESGATLKEPKVKVIAEGEEFDGWYTAAQDGEKYTFGALDASTTEVNIYAVTKEEEVVTGGIVGVYTYTPGTSDNPLSCVTGEGANYSADKIIKSTLTWHAGSSTAQFGGSAQTITLTFEAEAGTTLVLDLNYSSSGGSNSSGVVITATNATYVAPTGDDIPAAAQGVVSASGAETLASVTGTVAEDRTITYVVTETGEVTLTFVRSTSSGTRLYKLELTATKADEGNE